MPLWSRAAWIPQSKSLISKHEYMKACLKVLKDSIEDLSIPFLFTGTSPQTSWCGMLPVSLEIREWVVICDFLRRADLDERDLTFLEATVRDLRKKRHQPERCTGDLLLSAGVDIRSDLKRYAWSELSMDNYWHDDPQYLQETAFRNTKDSLRWAVWMAGAALGRKWTTPPDPGPLPRYDLPGTHWTQQRLHAAARALALSMGWPDPGLPGRKIGYRPPAASRVTPLDCFSPSVADQWVKDLAGWGDGPQPGPEPNRVFHKTYDYDSTPDIMEEVHEALEASGLSPSKKIIVRVELVDDTP